MMRNRLQTFCLVLLFLFAFSLTAAAQEFDPNQAGSISVSLVSKSGNVPMAGAELSLFCIAEVECGADGQLRYHYTEGFADCGIPLDDPELAQKLNEFLSGHTVAAQKGVTDSQGKALFEDLSLGLYFVKQTGEAAGFASCAPFLVTVPIETETGYIYHVDASPKADVAKLIDLTIRKVWNVDQAEDVPASVTVQLLRGENVVETAVLNGQNNWQITYQDLPESDAYRIVEIQVPQGFTATYSREGYVFTVTNTASLAQTGQLIWPIPVFALAGMIFLMMGFVILRKPGNQNA